VTDCVGPAKIERIGQLKVSTPVDEICSGLPHEFATFLAYSRSLRPYEMPDHAAARHMFRTLAERLCPAAEAAEADPAVFDWVGVDLDADDDDETADGNSPAARTESDEELAPLLSNRLSN